jgi:hypothetical protein
MIDRDTDPTQVNKQRTLKQNKAAHLYFAHLADTLNEHGLDMQAVLVKRQGIRWTEVSVKECLFKGLAKAMYNVDSTTKLSTKQFTKVAEMLGDLLARDYGVATQFPSMESLQNDKQSKELG